MKRLDRKGFTLVELLAVIIILAIVVGITIPAVLTTTSKAKEKAFKTAAQTAADWIDRQYQIINTGLEEQEMATIDSTIKAKIIAGVTENNGSEQTLSSTDNTGKKFIHASGLNPDNIATMKFSITNGRTCVKLTATSTGDYAGVGTGDSKNEMQGGAC